MKKTIEIMCSYGGKFNTGNYNQESDLFSVKTTLECDGGEDVTKDDIIANQKLNYALVYAMFQADYDRLNTKEAVITDTVQTTETKYETERTMDWIAIISQSSTISELTGIGGDIARQKNKIPESGLAEIRKEFNRKMEALKHGNKK